MARSRVITGHVMAKRSSSADERFVRLDKLRLERRNPDLLGPRHDHALQEPLAVIPGLPDLGYAEPLRHRGAGVGEKPWRGHQLGAHLIDGVPVLLTGHGWNIGDEHDGHVSFLR